MDHKTIETYNQLAQEYDQEVADFWNLFPCAVIDNFISQAGNRVLDVGSGSGRDGMLLKKAGLDVMCLDASLAMVELTQAKGLDSVLADFNNIPFGDQSFDGVWAYTSLLHVPKNEIKAVLAEVHRVLAREGVLGLGLIEGETEGYRESSGVNLPRYFAYYTKAEVEMLLAEAGFSIFYFDTFKPRSKNYLNFLAKKVSNN